MIRMTATAIAQVKVNLAVQHLMAASRFSKAVSEIEQEHAGQPFDDFFDGILHNATACVLLIGASMEANPNEIFADKEKHFPNHSSRLLETYWKRFERGSTIEKFQLALILSDRPE